MARYSKSASGNVKGAMERRKAGTLKSGKSGKTVRSKNRRLRSGCRRLAQRAKRFRARSPLDALEATVEQLDVPREAPVTDLVVPGFEIGLYGSIRSLV